MPLFPPQDYRKTEFTHRSGLAAARPLATDVLPGTLYFSTDTLVLERSNGTVWASYSLSSALSYADNNIIVGNGTTWVAESGATARTSLGLGTGDSPQFTALTTTAVAALTTAAESWIGPSTTAGVYFKGGFVGLGTPSPGYKLVISENAVALPTNLSGTMLQIGGADGSGPRVALNGFAANPSIVITRANGTNAIPTALTSGSGSGEVIGRIGATGHDGTSYSTLQAFFGFSTSESWTTTAHGTSFDWGITPLGSITLGVTGRVFSSGGLSIGLLSAGTIVDPGGYSLRVADNILIGSTKPSTGTNVAIFADGTAPSGLAANTAGLYADDVSGTVAMWAIDEAGLLSRLTGAASFPTSVTAPKIISTASVGLKGYTVATLPVATQGDIVFVTDALAPAFLAIIVGGGAVVAPVFYNGTNWVGF